MALAATVVVAGPTPAGGAPRPLVPDATAVPVGGSLVVHSGCPTFSSKLGSSQASVRLVVGTGASARLAALGRPSGTPGDLLFSLPGWVDPAEPAVLTGRCASSHYDPASGTWVEENTTFDDVVIDVIPGSPALGGPIVATTPAAPAGGQVLRIAGSGCDPAATATAWLVPGSDRSLSSPPGSWSAEGPVDRDGSFVIELFLAMDQVPGSGAAPGPYVLVVHCRSDETVWRSSEPAIVVVGPSKPVQDFAIAYDEPARRMVLSGADCLGPSQARVTITGYSTGSGFHQGPPQPDSGGLPTNSTGPFTAHLGAGVSPDGTWSVPWRYPGGYVGMPSIVADCGDPSGDGFRYLSPLAYFGSLGFVHVRSVLPADARPGQRVRVALMSADRCGGPVTIELTDRYGETIRVVPVDVAARPDGADVTVPAQPDAYFAVATCRGLRGLPRPFQVGPGADGPGFGATPVGMTAPAPAASRPVPVPGAATYVG
ncbi:MAG: hypothetical protein JWM47_1926 [Acidimicrobiales bacterium]|nr:hypothetical protein [Acidimicrobiales bacterium]